MTLQVQARDGLRLAVDREGSGDAVVFVHGLGFSRERWSGTTRVLNEAGYQVLTFDLRGFGDSEVPTDAYGMEDLVADLEAVTAGMDRFHLVGHSLGGMCAQLFALAHPERIRSLTLVSTTSHSGTRGSAYGAALSYLAMRGFDEAMKDEAFRAKVEWAVEFLADPEVRQELNGTISHELPSGEKLLGLIERMTRQPDPARAYAWSCTVGFSTRDRLSEIRCPSLVMHGTRDMIIPYIAGQLLDAGLEGSKWISFQGAGHSVPMEREPEFTQALVEFLEAVPG